MITIDQTSCVRCGACVRECPGIILEQNSDGVAQVVSSRESCCIKCQHCVAICPAGAVSVDGVGANDCLPKGELPSEEQMLNLIRMRRSIRSWSDRPIEPETIEQLKNVLNWTATGCNDHSLRFAFVTSPAIFDELRTKIYGFINRPIINRILRWKFKKFRHYFDAMKNGTDVIFRNAPGMVIALIPKSAPCAAFDPVIALSNFDLYAQTLGLGTCWCGFAEGIFKHRPKLVRGLELPKGYRVGAVMLFGYPSAPYLRSTAQKPFETQLID